MHGLIAKLTLAPGRRNERTALLNESAANMPGCLSYVISKDVPDENVLGVTEVRDSAQSHEAAISLPQVKSVIPRAKAILANFEKVAVIDPIRDLGSHPGYVALESSRRK